MHQNLGSTWVMTEPASQSPPLRPRRSHQITYKAQGHQPPPLYEAPAHENPSLDLPQRIERKFAEYNASQNVVKRWLFEIISWTTSAVCMGAIVGICLYSRDQPLSKYPWTLTINNVLSKIASAALILPISEAIGQLKWAWFSGSKSKEIVDFEIFDKASRGAWGSFLLLFRTKGRSLAALGAVLTLLLLATDTFFQQVTELPVRWAIDGFGEIPRVIRYTGDNGDLYEDGGPIAMDDINLRQATQQSFYYNGSQPIAFGNGTRPEIPLSCPSSRCEWDTYDSLAVCSTCTDVSDLLSYACLTTKLDWISSVFFNESTQPTEHACGYWLNATSDKPVLMSGYRVDNSSNSSAIGEALLLRTLPLSAPIVSVVPFSNTPPYGGSINYKNIYYPLLDAIIVSAADGTAASVYENRRPIANECILSLCVKTFQSTYVWGNYEESVVKTFFNTTRSQQPYPYEVNQTTILDQVGFSYSFKGNISIRPPSMDTNAISYGVSNETYDRTAGLFEEVFPSYMTVSNVTATPWWRVRVPHWTRNQLRPVTAAITCPLLAPNNITQYTERLATTMTNIIRSHKSHVFVRGRAYSQITFIAVHWGWLAFPLVLLFLSLGFLVATILKTSDGKDGDMGIWKTSAMPTLIYSLPKETQKEFTSPGAWKHDSHGKNKKIKIRMLPRQGWRVSGQVCTSPTHIAENNHRAPPGWV